MAPHFEHERRLEVKQAFSDIERKIEDISKDMISHSLDISATKQRQEADHRENTKRHYEFEQDVKTLKLKMDGDGNGNEGVIRKMDRLKNIPELMRSNTNTMRWMIGIMVAANLGMFSAIIAIAKHP